MAKRKLIKDQDRGKLIDIPVDEDSLIRHYSLSLTDRLLTHQFDEHRYRIVRELLAKLDDLSHDQSVATAGIEVVGKPGWGCVTLPDHLVSPSC